MKLLTFLRLMREIRKKGKTDIEKIQRMGLLAVKLSQIFALRPDLLSPEKCKELRIVSKSKFDSTRRFNENTQG